MNDAGSLKPTKTLNVKGLLCPIPVLKAKQAIETISPGDVLEILATDPAAESDISVWTKRAGHELLLFENKEGVLRFFVKRRA